MKKPTLEERINEVTSQISYFESEQERNPNKSISKIIRDLKVKKGVLEAIKE